MPLNTEDSGERRPPERDGRSFAPPTAPGRPGPNRSLLLWIFLAVVLIAIFFLLLQFGVIPSGGDSRGRGAAGPGDADSAVHAPVSARDTSGVKSVKDRAAALRERLSGLRGEYTIFIGALRDSADAGELAGRWERAGYPAYIIQSSGWYRVGLGRYATADLAREDAEKLRQAFEEGYWIGRAAP